MVKRGLKIVVVGAGKVGDTLVNRLADEGHNLVIIDKNVERLNQLADQCDCMCISGSGASHEILEEAGVSESDLFIAVTESDELNLLCCTLRCHFSHIAIYHDIHKFLKTCLGWIPAKLCFGLGRIPPKIHYICWAIEIRAYLNQYIASSLINTLFFCTFANKFQFDANTLKRIVAELTY